MENVKGVIRARTIHAPVAIQYVMKMTMNVESVALIMSASTIQEQEIAV